MPKTKKQYRPHIPLREHEQRDLKAHAARLGLPLQDLMAHILRGWLDKQAGVHQGEHSGSMGEDVEALLIAAATAIHHERQKLSAHRL